LTNKVAIVDSGDAAAQGWLGAAEAAVDGAAHSIEHLLQTHAHVDHVAGLAETKELLPDALIYLHEDDNLLLSSSKAQGVMFGLSCSMPPPADTAVTDGMQLNIGDIQMTVLHTPGDRTLFRLYALLK